MNTAVSIAEAVVAELNGATFSMPVVAARTYLPEFELPEMADLHVTVVPRAMIKAPLGRSIMSAEIQVDVGVQKKLAQGGNAEIDGLLALVEEIAEFFEQRHLMAIPEAVWVRTEHKPLYATDHLDSMRQFTSVITLTFRLAR